MTVTYYPGRDLPQEDLPDERQHRRQIARTVGLLMRGQSNATCELTLEPNVTSTTVIDARCSLQTAPLLIPKTANAAAELANGTLYVAPSKGQIVVTHANNAQTDRIFQLALIG